MRDEWEEKFQAWKTQKNKPAISIEPIKPKQEYKLEKSFREPIRHPIIYNETKPSKLAKPSFLIILAILIIAIAFLYKNPELAKSTLFLIILAISALSFLFLFLLFTHRTYEHSIYKIAPSTALAFTYGLLIANMFLGSRIYSVEWAFLGFILSAVILYDFKIDSRFLILPAILLLAYIPFLLLGAQEPLAELIAIYVYYFLVAGVILQIIEYAKKTQLSLDFEQFMSILLKKDKIITLIIIFGIISVALIIANRFISIELAKWSSVYLFFLMLALYGISFLAEQNKHITKQE